MAMTPTRQIFRFFLLTVLGLATVLSLGSCSDSLPADPGDPDPTIDGWIVFAEETDGGAQIKALSTTRADSIILQGELFSKPQGNRIVYVERGGNTAIAVSNIDGSDKRTVPLPSIDGMIEPGTITLSPTGQVAFSYTPSNGTDPSVYLILVDPNDNTFYQVLTNRFKTGTSPAFSADGSMIAMYLTSDDLFAADLTDVAVVNLLAGPTSLPNVLNRSSFSHAFGQFTTLDWSSDGSKLLYHGDDSLWVYDFNPSADSSRFLTAGIQGTFSHDGNRVAFVRGSFGLGMNVDLWIMNSDGSSQRKLTNTLQTLEVFPAWSPDNNWILVSAATFNSGVAELQAINVDRPTFIKHYGSQVYRGFWIDEPLF